MNGKYSVPDDRIDEFYRLYINALANGDSVCLTEVHESISPLLVDLDFRFPIDIGVKRMYTPADIENVIRLYNNQIRHHFDVD